MSLLSSCWELEGVINVTVSTHPISASSRSLPGSLALQHPVSHCWGLDTLLQDAENRPGSPNAVEDHAVGLQPDELVLHSHIMEPG
jgi:hypothetical protein